MVINTLQYDDLHSHILLLLLLLLLLLFHFKTATDCFVSSLYRNISSVKCVIVGGEIKVNIQHKGGMGNGCNFDFNIRRQRRLGSSRREWEDNGKKDQKGLKLQYIKVDSVNTEINFRVP